MRKVGVLGCVCCVLAFWLISPALASPVFTLETASDFQDAISANLIQPQTDLDGDPSLAVHYPTGTFMEATPIPYIPEGDYEFIGDSDGGLVMEWDRGDPEDADVYAQWLYVYDEDPNLVGKVIKGTVFAPRGITSLSFSIIDQFGSSRSWDWNVTPPSGLGPIFNNVLTPFTINVVGLGLGGPNDATPISTGYFDARFPNGVGPLTDPTQITTLGFDENGNYVVFVQVSPTGGTGPWNYFGRIQTVVIPEPSTLVLLCMGAFGLLLHVSRRRK